MDSVIQFEGTIYENGYGLLARNVMRDYTLPKQSRLIYAYMCSFASVGQNGERVAFPSISLQCYELEMNEDTYYKWRKPLIERGLIKITKQRQEGSKFDRNLYSIVAVPVPVEKAENPESGDKEPYPKKSGTDKKPYPKFSGTEKPSTEKSGTKISSSKISSFNILEEEEEKLVVTIENVISFANEQIQKREITNKKTLFAIYEQLPKCKVIGTSNFESMQNYVVKVIEEKMSKLGQKQKEYKKSSKKPIRTEVIPEWMNKDESKEEVVITEEATKKKTELEEKLKKYKK
jgi:hypothetical protein